MFGEDVFFFIKNKKFVKEFSSKKKKRNNISNYCWDMRGEDEDEDIFSDPPKF